MQRRTFCKLAAIGGFVTGMTMLKNKNSHDLLVVVVNGGTSSERQAARDQLAEAGISAIFMPANVSVLTVGKPDTFYCADNSPRHCTVLADGQPLQFVDWLHLESGLVCRFVPAVHGSVFDSNLVSRTRIVEQYDLLGLCPVVA